MGPGPPLAPRASWLTTWTLVVALYLLSALVVLRVERSYLQIDLGALQSLRLPSTLAKIDASGNLAVAGRIWPGEGNLVSNGGFEKLSSPGAASPFVSWRTIGPRQLTRSARVSPVAFSGGRSAQLRGSALGVVRYVQRVRVQSRQTYLARVRVSLEGAGPLGAGLRVWGTRLQGQLLARMLLTRRTDGFAALEARFSTGRHSTVVFDVGTFPEGPRSRVLFDDAGLYRGAGVVVLDSWPWIGAALVGWACYTVWFFWWAPGAVGGLVQWAQRPRAYWAGMSPPRKASAVVAALGVPLAGGLALLFLGPWRATPVTVGRGAVLLVALGIALRSSTASPHAGPAVRRLLLALLGLYAAYVSTRLIPWAWVLRLWEGGKGWW